MALGSWTWRYSYSLSEYLAEVELANGICRGSGRRGVMLTVPSNESAPHNPPVVPVRHR